MWTPMRKEVGHLSLRAVQDTGLTCVSVHFLGNPRICCDCKVGEYSLEDKVSLVVAF